MLEQTLEELETEFDLKFSELGIAQEHNESVHDFLRILKRKHVPTYKHSLRVGLSSTRVARHIHADEKMYFFAGSLHDIGKILIPKEILDKTEGFNERDMAIIRKHPLYSRMILKDIHPLSAEAAGRHHMHQKDFYPKHLPKPTLPFSRDTMEVITECSRMLALCDFYDALVTRKNDKFGGKGLDADQAKIIMITNNTSRKKFIEDLYVNGIFGDNGAKPKTGMQEGIHRSLWKDFEGRRTPREIRRFVTLACTMEPLSEKAGCTTREGDASQHLRLEYFVAGGVNIGDAFEDLAMRVLEIGEQPKLIYDLALKAQVDCARNRSGGRINQGIIEMLMPIVTAQMLYDRNYETEVKELLDKTARVLKSTTPEDVAQLIEMKKAAYALSDYDREVPVYDVKSVYDYYAADLESSRKEEKITGVKHNEEFVLKFPTVGDMYRLIRTSSKLRFNSKVADAYNVQRAGNHAGTGVGLTADCAACAIYLTLSNNPTEEVIV